MPLNLFYTMVQKSQKWPKTQIKGGGPAWSSFPITMTFCKTNFGTIFGKCSWDFGRYEIYGIYGN